MIGALNLNRRDVTVIGGGIAGLLIAYTLDKSGYEVRLVEAQDRLGGLIRTEKTPWGIAESAAHSVLATEKVHRFCSDLGIELVDLKPDSKARFILRNGKLRRFPLRIKEVLEAAFRAYFVLADRKTPPEKMNVEKWVERYLGQAALHYLFTPMVQGIYGADPNEILISAAFPSLVVPRGHSLLSFQFAKLIRGKIRRRRGRDKPKMMAPRGGMEDLVHALEARLRESLGDRVITQSSSENLPEAGNLVLAVPAYAASRFFEKQDPKLSQALKNVPYTSLVSANIFIKKENLIRVPKGVGVLIPEIEGSACLGVLFNSSSFPERVLDEDQWVSLTVMLGGSRNPEALYLTDDVIKEMIQRELTSLMVL